MLAQRSRPSLAATPASTAEKRTSTHTILPCLGRYFSIQFTSCERNAAERSRGANYKLRKQFLQDGKVRSLEYLGLAQANTVCARVTDQPAILLCERIYTQSLLRACCTAFASLCAVRKNLPGTVNEALEQEMALVIVCGSKLLTVLKQIAQE